MVGLPLIIGVSTRALYDLTEEHEVFRAHGHAAYADIQLKREDQVLKPGVAFEVTQRLLKLNKGLSTPVVIVVLLSKNSPDLSIRAFRSCVYYNLSVKHGSFTSGRSVAPYVPAWNVDLFLSNDSADVRSVFAAGIAAAHFGTALPVLVTENAYDFPADEVRLAFDGDAVLFSAASDQIYKEQGLACFLEHEVAQAMNPMAPGPLGKTFLPKLALLREMFMREDGTSRVRISLITARNAPAHERVVNTFRAWGTPADEAHFVGSTAKGRFLAATRAHIFFDDQLKHVESAGAFVPSGLVPGPHDPSNLIIPGND